MASAYKCDICGSIYDVKIDWEKREVECEDKSQIKIDLWRFNEESGLYQELDVCPTCIEAIRETLHNRCVGISE